MAVKNLIFPAMDVIWPDTWEALKTLREKGVTLWFAVSFPAARVGERVRFAEYDFREEALREPECREKEGFRAVSETEILEGLKSREKD